MRKQGIVSLLEIGFISCPGDLASYEARKNVLAIKIADIVKKYEAMI